MVPLIQNIIRPMFRIPVIVSEAIINFFIPPVKYYSNDYESMLRPLKDNFNAIQKEVLDYVSSFEMKNFEDIIPGNNNIPSFKGAFKIAPLKAFEVYFEKPLSKCPVLYRVLREIKTIKVITISKLAPHSAIKPHFGSFGGYIRTHLGIKIPEGDTALIVGGEKRKGSEGEFLFFNDRQYHTAYNNTDEERIIFLIDMVRPLPFPLNILNNAVAWLISRSPFFRQIIKNADAD